VVKLLEPLSNGVVAVAEAYQSTVDPVGGVAVKVTVPAPQREFDTTAGVAGNGVTVATTAVRVAETHVLVVDLDST
jgi:hypothetical protein